MTEQEERECWDKVWKELKKFFCNTVCKKAMDYKGLPRRGPAPTDKEIKADLFNMDEDVPACALKGESNVPKK